jgi:hypothetical protein
LQFVLAAPSPSKFCTAVRIVRYSPDSILNFVSKTSSLDPSSDKFRYPLTYFLAYLLTHLLT